jgi:hypothetical protein
VARKNPARRMMSLMAVPALSSSVPVHVALA